MSQKFVKGRTNNHLTWVMVDATDFATPESALSAATKIKIYGKLRSATGTNFVSSGTGSLTNDITHVGASATGIYTIALAKADLSDASAAWYDQYIVSLSATGAAYQTLIVDGGIDDSAVSNTLSYLSNIVSYLSNAASNLSAVVSDIRSDVSDLHSDLLVMSGVLSDVYSLVSDAHSAAILGASHASDAASAAAQANSRVLLVQSRLSDLDSRLSSDVSDLTSALSDFHSDFDSRVPKAVATQSQLSDLHSDLRSYLVGLSAALSDTYSAVSDFQSDFGSRVPKAVATSSQLSDLHSDLRSMLTVMSGVLSDAQSATAATQSLASDTYSLVAVVEDALRNKQHFLKSSGELTTYKDDGTTVLWSNIISSDATSVLRGAG